MADYIYTNGRLYNANELKHWKYVKKKKVNGKWRYYYSDEEYQSAKNEYDQAKNKYDYATRRKIVAKSNLEGNAKLYLEDDKIDSREAKWLGEHSKAYRDASAAYTDAGKKYVTSSNAFKYVRNKTAVRRFVAKGVAAVGNLFRKLFG